MQGRRALTRRLDEVSVLPPAGLDQLIFQQSADDPQECQGRS